MKCLRVIRRISLPTLPLIALWIVLLALITGCSSTKRTPGQAPGRRFDFSQDTFGYTNELVWAYGYDENGNWAGHRREPSPEYTLHCFVMARSVVQFFEHARFDPQSPVATEDTYRRLIRSVVKQEISQEPPASEKIVIPGYANLRDFSAGQEKLLKSECGSYLESYFQRGNWRMILPFSRGHQKNTAERVVEQVIQNRPVVLHLVRFPQLSINHAMVVYAAEEQDEGILFVGYDPNEPGKPVHISYDPESRTFSLIPTQYFPGGRVDVYQVYHRWNY